MLTTRYGNEINPEESSHWTRLSEQVQNLVLAFAGPLTLFLNNRLANNKDAPDQDKLSIWLEAFDLEFQGDLAGLPDLNKKTLQKIVDKFASRVKSRSMYERLCGRFPEASETNPAFKQHDMNMTTLVFERRLPSETEDVTDGWHSCRLLHIPMHNMWTDLIHESIRDFPYARANDCITHDHTELLKHLVDTNAINLRVIKSASEPKMKPLLPVDYAGQRGHLGILKIFHESKCWQTSGTLIDVCIDNDYREMARWIYENRLGKIGRRGLNGVAANGGLQMVKFLISKGRPWGQIAVVNAAIHGHLDIVKLLCSKFDGDLSQTVKLATMIGSPHVVAWLNLQYNHQCTLTTKQQVIEQGYLCVLKQIYTQHPELAKPEDIVLAAKCGHFDIAKFLRDRCADWDIVYEALKNSKTIEVANLFVECMGPKTRKEVLKMARENNWAKPARQALAPKKRKRTDEDDDDDYVE